ncbi:MAG: aldolase [Patescibacteria group bacterium]|nr:aldolase [Patescibacteria group bacterium]MDD4303991.1 aldolase [Patescibacteria group bacterium]
MKKKVLKKITSRDVLIPLDVPILKRKEYVNNYLKITRNSGRLMLFAGDQKIEHLNDDFYGENISDEDASPEHLFRIASKAKIGVFATQLGLIARYGMDYKNIPYLVKLNGKSNLVRKEQEDPISRQFTELKDVVEFKRQNKLNILGVGYTIYLGSEYEAEMLVEASSIINDAHQEGLVVVLWIYPRGKAIKVEKDVHLIAGATGVASCLGADFVKVIYPDLEGEPSPEMIKEIISASGRTKVVFSGGESMSRELFLKRLIYQLENGAMGAAIGRNIHQKSLKDAVEICNDVYSIIVEGKTTF